MRMKCMKKGKFMHASERKGEKKWDEEEEDSKQVDKRRKNLI